MLKIVNYNQDEYEFPCLLVLGCFDGIHAGHAELLKKAKLQAKINGLDLGVMMFSEGKGGKLVYTFEERLKFLEQYNVKFVLKIDFNEAFKATKPLDFLQTVEEKLNVKAYMSGKDFRFGAGAKGKSSTLKSYAEDEENGVMYMSVKDVAVDNEKVSTSAVKKLLENGDISGANLLLGRSFSVNGTVQESNGELFISYPANKVELKSGVYVVKCLLEDAEYFGTATFGNLLNLCLENLGEDICGKEITVEFTDVMQSAEPTAELAVTSEPETPEETQSAPEASAESPEAVVEEIPAQETEVCEEQIPEEEVSAEAAAEDEAFEEELEEEFIETEEPSTETAAEEAPVEEESEEITEPEEEIVPETQVEVAQEALVEEAEVPEEQPSEDEETVCEKITVNEEEAAVEEFSAEETEEELPAEAEEITEEAADETEPTEEVPETQVEWAEENSEDIASDDTTNGNGDDE